MQTCVTQHYMYEYDTCISTDDETPVSLWAQACITSHDKYEYDTCISTGQKLYKSSVYLKCLNYAKEKVLGGG